MCTQVYEGLVDIGGLPPSSLRRLSQANPELPRSAGLDNLSSYGIPPSLPSKVGIAGIPQVLSRLKSPSYLHLNLLSQLPNPEVILFRRSSDFSERRKKSGDHSSSPVSQSRSDFLQREVLVCLWSSRVLGTYVSLELRPAWLTSVQVPHVSCPLIDVHPAAWN